MDERRATAIAERWSGGGGLVPRGPRWLLAYRPVPAKDVERHTGRRPPSTSRVWRLEVGGRFLRSGGLVYPGGVPFPEDLRHETAVVASEVWLYVTDDGDMLGLHSWPEAVRKPIASVVADDFDAEDLVHPADASRLFGWDVPLPDHPGWDPAVVVGAGAQEVIVLCVRELLPQPLNEMVLYASDGVSLRVRAGVPPSAIADALARHQPPFRPVRVRGSRAMGREPGKPLGPQTWPWPGELIWWDGEARFELKGFQPLQTLVGIAETVRGGADAGSAAWEERP